MDALAGLLEGPRAHGAFMIRACFDPPWCVRVEDRAPLSVMLMVRGESWTVPDSGDPVLIRPGDLAIACGPDPYTCADDPAKPPRVVVLPGGACATPDGRCLEGTMDLAVRTWGDSVDGSGVMLRDGDRTVGTIARQVGYGSAFALSNAFKRVYGVSPQEHRTRAA